MKIKLLLAKLWDRFKINSPKTATAVAGVLISLIITIEYFIGQGTFGDGEVVARAIEIILFVRLTLAGSRTTRHLEKEEDVLVESPSAFGLSAMNLITDGEEEIFKYVKPEARVGYAQKLNAVTLNMMGGAPKDIVLSRMEAVYFSPQDVTLGNRNWMLDNFADVSDHTDFAKYDNGQKFYVYHLDTGVDKYHPDMKKAVVDQWSFTGDAVGDVNGHGTFSASMYGSTNIDHSPFIDKINRGEIVIGDVKVLGDDGSGDFNQIVEAIQFVANDAPNKQKQGYKTFINMSLGADAQTPEELSDALKNASDAGVLNFAATGNSGLGKIGTPANDVNVVAVTAITPELKRANFANIGKGVTFAEGGVMCYGATLDGQSGFNNGTSFSCPWLINIFITACSLYKFDSNERALTYAKKTAQDLGETGYDIVYGYGYGVMRWMLNNPPKDQSLINIDEPVDQVLKEEYTFKTINGFEITWREKGMRKNHPYSTLFIEELDINYSGFLSPDEAEKFVIEEINKAVNGFKFIVTDKMNYISVGKFVLLFLEEYFKSNEKGISFSYALIDNNQDANIMAEIDDDTLHGKEQKYYLFDPESWTIRTNAQNIGVQGIRK